MSASPGIRKSPSPSNDPGLGGNLHPMGRRHLLDQPVLDQDRVLFQDPLPVHG